MARRALRNIVLGLIGGLLAGPALGLAEWLAVNRTAAQVDTGALVFAIVAYTVVGAAFGVGLGIATTFVAELRRRRRPDRQPASLPAWAGLARYWAATIAVAGFVVARFRIARDVFDEQLRLFSAQGLLVHGGLLAAALGLVALVWWLTRPPKLSRDAAGSSAAPDSGDEHAASERPAAGSAPALPYDPTRRRFLRAAVTMGLMAAPPVAALARLRSSAPAEINLPSVIRTTGVLPSALRERPNILYVMVDTLRADYLSSYGYPRAISPRIDALAAEGLRYHNHFAQASWTRPCVACQLSAMYPSSHRAIHKADRLPDAVTTLPEVLAREGYATAGFAANANIAPLFNFGQGFHYYDFLAPRALFGASESAEQLTIYQGLRLINERFVSSAKSPTNFYYPAEAINERAIDWMRMHLDQRFFLFLHYMDPHDPYFEHPYNGYGIARVSTPNPPPDMAEELKRLYIGEIKYLDRQLGELFGWLAQQGLYDNTLVVFTSDHGEEFYEHGGWWHGLTLYDEQIRVPLIIKPPADGLLGSDSIPRGAVDAALAQQIDIMPTVLGALGLASPAGAQGINLLDAPQRLEATFAENQLEGNVLESLRGSQWKVIRANEGNPRGLPPVQLFNVAADPGEQADLAASQPDRVAQMSTELDRMGQWAVERAVQTQQADLDAATLEQLRNIGY